MDEADADENASAADDTPGDDAAESGTFLVTAADEASAVLREVHRGRVYALADNSGLSAGETVVGAVAPVPPLETAWRLVETDERYRVSVVASDQAPTARARELVPETVGEVARTERAGDGELHVIAVPEDGTEAAVADVLDDEEGLRARASRLGVGRVEVRSAPGVVSVRYLP
ncbi:MAG: DUF5812 family protein [Haloferacaceae archaeon]